MYYMNQTLYQNIGQRFYFYLPTIFLIIFLQFQYTLQIDKKKKFFKLIIISICLFSVSLNFIMDTNPFNILKKRYKIKNFKIRIQSLVIYEVIFDFLRLIAQCNVEVFMVKICISIHNVMNNWLIANLYHRLGNKLA